MGIAFFGIIVILAFLGLLFVKNGELAGLGREHKRGGFRSPHGKLVRTKRLDSVEETSFLEVFPKLVLILGAITVAIFALSFLGIIAWDGSIGVTLDFVVVIAVATLLMNTESEFWKPAGYAVAGYLALSVIPSIVWVFVPSVDASLSVGFVNGLSMLLGTIGAAAVVSLMPTTHTYAREFEDGHVNTIQVSHRSVACKAYVSLEDPTWKPPADRIQNPEMASNPRAFMRRD